jgi:hypothetical protein
LHRHHLVAGPSCTIPYQANHKHEVTEHTQSIGAFVERTTTSSGVPLFVEDLGVIDQIGRVLSSNDATTTGGRPSPEQGVQ